MFKSRIKANVKGSPPTPNLSGSGVNSAEAKWGFTIIELLATLAIFAILITGVLGSFAAVSRSVKLAREKDTLASLATNYLEIVRNMPYSQVGTAVGNPNGTLPDCGGIFPNCPNAYSQTIGGATYKIYYKVSYVHDPADPVSVINPSYKQVKMDIGNTITGQITNFITTVVPKGLISNPNTGAIQVTVLNSQGQILPGVNVEIYYPATAPYTYHFTDTTNASGQVTEIGLPAAVNSYRVVASKAGYSTDQTYAISAGNPSPINPDMTVVNGVISPLTLAIDLVSNLNIRTLNSTCQPVNGVNISVGGSKSIGTSPNVVKFNNSYTSSGGAVNLNNLEWDTYLPGLDLGQSWIIRGTSPIQQITVNAGTSQTFTMILDTNSTVNSLLVVVKDATSAALENATVTLSKGGTQIQTLYTAGSVWTQNDWSGGNGQNTWSVATPSRYFTDDGNIDTITLPAGIRLSKPTSSYSPSGSLESSTFDTGTNATNYTILNWQPTSQSASTTVTFQVAASNDTTLPWDYVGPDGTASTYFTVPGTDIGSIIDNKQYFRYKVFLATSDPSITPVVTSVSSNFVTGCFTPGQVIFTDLTAASDYGLNVSYPGFATQDISPITVGGNAALPVLMGP